MNKKENKVSKEIKINKKSARRNYSNQTGITLIALVVTIVVFLILAAVTINAIFGENGLIKQIDIAKEKNEIAEYVDDLNRKLLEARINVANDESKILEETKRLVAEDEKYNEATIGEIEGDNKFTVITKEGYEIDVKKDGATYVDKVTETAKKVKLTVKHINKSGTELKATTETEYDKDTAVTVKSETISGYKTYSAKITATEVNETLTEGAPVELSFGIYMDTEVVITYDVLQSGETEKEYEEKPTVSNSTEPVRVKPVEKDSSIKESLPTDIKNSDNSYMVDIEPVKSNSGPLTITLDVSDKAEDGDTANVRHYKNSVWDNLGDFTVTEGKITFTIDSFSPFCITIKKKGSSGGNTTTPPTPTVKKYTEASKNGDGTLAENAEYTDPEKAKVTIPKGFKVSEVAATEKTDGEQTVSKGLVIQDKDGNEFVWIPVNYTATNVDANSNGLDDGFEAIFKRSTTNSRFTEPYASGYTGENTEYLKMMQSVQANKGFYIGRYEAGTTSPRDESTTTTTSTVVVKRDAYPYIYVKWGDAMNTVGNVGAVYLSKNMYAAGTIGATSTLCYGVQWDAAMKFVKDSTHSTSNSTTWGNYQNNAWTINRTTAKYTDSTNAKKGSWTPITSNKSKTDSESILLTTGASDNFKAKNIFDLAGNVYEWTMEADSSTVRVRRGGYYDTFGSNYPASSRNSYNPTLSHERHRFPSSFILVALTTGSMNQKK